MKTIITILFAVFCSSVLAQKTPNGVTYDTKIIRVNDGRRAGNRNDEEKEVMRWGLLSLL